MTNYRPNIVIDGEDLRTAARPAMSDAEAKRLRDSYEAEVEFILDTIYFKPPRVGRLVIDEIVTRSPAGHKLRKLRIVPPKKRIEEVRSARARTIEPYLRGRPFSWDADGIVNPWDRRIWATEKPPAYQPLNEIENPWPPPGSLTDGKPEFPKVLDDCEADYGTGAIEKGVVFKGTRGTGAGSNVHIQYWPGDLEELGTPGKLGKAQDDILVHELVHAMRIMQGTFNPETGEVPEEKRFNFTEEWLAVLLTNIYMSEKGDQPLRGRYEDAFSPMPGFNESASFLLGDRINLHLMCILEMKHRALFTLIGTLALAQPTFGGFGDPRRFNPIRFYRDNMRALNLRDAARNAAMLAEAGREAMRG
jgi:hypothetical protein